MTHELILTSVAQGLDPNEHGFCLVAADAAVSSPLVQSLSALSHYRHLTATTESARSSVVYSHLILPDGQEHVLSRTAEVGVDYQQQPNTLAHHVILDDSEFVVEGPAWLLALPAFHLTEWNESPLRFVHGRPLPTLTNPPSLTRRQQIARQSRWLDPQKMALTGAVDTQSDTYFTAVRRNDEQIALAAAPTSPCPTWQELTGDAGWGGILAETALTQQPVVLIYKPEQNILPLFVEALALLPTYFPWLTTFCTDCTGLPDTISCQWKGIVAGSSEVKTLARNLNNLVIDLTIPMGLPQTGRYLDFARFGQEHMLPLDSEEYSTALINADTKPHGEYAKKEQSQVAVPSTERPELVSTPVIQPRKKQSGLFESFLHRSSRSQFYLLYGITFVLVLFLLFLVLDQAGNYGILQWLRTGNPQEDVVPPEELDLPIEPDGKNGIDSELDRTDPDVPENVPKISEENRAAQKESLLQFWKSFDVPEYLAINFPDVQDGQVDVPEPKTFAELEPLHPFGSALELHFIPLFELSESKVETEPVPDALPDLVWRVQAIDQKTPEGTPMFRFQLTETGLEMTWQQEGLNPQHLYDTVLSSLGFLQLSVADEPETAKMIPLFAPVQAKPVKVSELMRLAESETPEYVVELPFASELWQNVFAHMSPTYHVVLEVTAEPEGDWAKIEPSSSSAFLAEVQTSQEILKQAGEYESIGIQFSAAASLEHVVWKGDEYADLLRSEQVDIDAVKEDLDKSIKLLEPKAFDGDADAKREKEKCQAELKTLDRRLNEIDSLLEKLPAAYQEIGQNETWQFHFDVFLKSTEGERKLHILTTRF